MVFAKSSVLNQGGVKTIFVLLMLFLMLLTAAQVLAEVNDMQLVVYANGPYEVWGGFDEAVVEDSSADPGYNIDEQEYVKLGAASGNAAFPGNYRYYVVATHSLFSLDAICLPDGSYPDKQHSGQGRYHVSGNVHLPWQFDENGLIGSPLDYSNNDYIYGPPDSRTNDVGCPPGSGYSTLENYEGFVSVGNPDIIRVVRLEVSDNVEIKNVANPVWQKEFGANGELESIPQVNNPIAAFEKFTLNVTLDDPNNCPKRPDSNPRVVYKYEVIDHVTGSVFNDRGRNEAELDIDFTQPEWTDDIKIYAPKSVGKYNLKLTFYIYEENEDLIKEQQIEPLTLYVTLNQPKGADTSTPKEAWLDKATEWASGASDEESILTELTHNIYDEADWTYTPDQPGWKSLLSTPTATQADCHTTAQLWDGLAKVLGLNNTYVTYTAKYGIVPFLTTSPATAFDGKTGNVRPFGSAEHNRWYFLSHSVGASTINLKYYDPTLNKIYGSFYDFIEYEEEPSPWLCVDPLTYRLKKNFEDEIYILLENQTGTWDQWVSYGIDSQTMLLNYKSLSSEQAGGNANFTGTYSVSTLDDEGDGRFNQLIVEAELDISELGNYTISGWLTADTNYITEREYQYSTVQTSGLIENQTGLIDVNLGFSGFDIGNRGIGGPYTVSLYLTDANGIVVDQIDFNTPAYSASEFGETSAEILSSSDIGVDTDSDSLFDELLVTVDINVFQTRNYFLDATIATDDGNVVIYADANEVVSTGAQTIEVVFDGREINKMSEPNHFVLNLVLHDSNGQQDQATFVTNFYNPADFERKDVLVNGPYVDNGYDVDGDDLFDSLRLDVGLDVIEPNQYSVTAWLQDPNGYDIIYAHADADLVVGQHSISLDFDGISIYRHGVDGPYDIVYVLVKKGQQIIDSASNVHRTAAYGLDEFESGIVFYADFDLEYSHETPLRTTEFITSVQSVKPDWWLGLDNESIVDEADWQIDSIVFQAPYELSEFDPLPDNVNDCNYIWNNILISPDENFEVDAEQNTEVNDVNFPFTITRSFSGNYITTDGNMTTTVTVTPQAGLDGFNVEIFFYGAQSENALYSGNFFATLSHVYSSGDSNVFEHEGSSYFQEYNWEVSDNYVPEQTYTFSCTVNVDLNENIDWALIEPEVSVECVSLSDAGSEVWSNNTLQLPNGSTITINSSDFITGNNTFIPFLEVRMPQYAATSKFDPLADLNGDDVIDFYDFALFASHWLDPICNVSNNFCERADIDQSEGVDFDDLATLAINWLAQP